MTCPYCDLAEPDQVGWVHADEHWLVNQGPAATTMAGGLRVTSRRHFTDFAEMTSAEAATFGILLHRLDAALRAVTDAERVHLVSTRDRVPHFHAWLYPRPAAHPLRGTAFLDAPQSGDPAAALRTARAVRDRLGAEGVVDIGRGAG
ncbi:HIT family protein [Actinosynnema sp. CS-041913]|uniref:HIT family protein n=1 Tax=Actinosynnema sp. CS-041913 TaxID=3239917 RepID=UPI003D8F2B86